MRLVADWLLTLGFPTVLFSLAMMGCYLVRSGVYTVWQLRTKLLWPEIIFEYRDHTRRHLGKVGIVYYVFLVAMLLVGIAASAELAIITLPAPLPIIIVVWFTYALLVPLLGFVIYRLSQEKHF
jgi:hypothetical protein